MSTSLTVQSYIVAEVKLHSNGVYGGGNTDMPVLVISLDFTLRCPPNESGLPERALRFRELQCRVRPADSPHGSKYIGVGIPISLDFLVKSTQVFNNQMESLEIPLDRARVAALNRARKGGDVVLSLDLKLIIDDLVEVARTKDRFRPSIWGLRDQHEAQGKMQITIPRSDWVQYVLPNMEFEKTHIIELPAVPIEASKENKAAFDALQQAQKLESQGFYKEAVAQCRIALEPFWEFVESTDGTGTVTKVPKLKTSWETRLGQHTYDWLNKALGCVKQGTNPSHHHTAVVFGQLEAQILLMVATALMVYAVKTAPES